MAIVRRAKAPTRDHVGFGWDGSLIRSEVPIDNQPTNFVRFLTRKVCDEFQSPMQAVNLIACERPEVRQVFSMRSMDQWGELHRFWQWPLAWTSRSIEATVKYLGRPHGLWSSDPNAWEKMVRRACHARGERLPHE